MIQLGLYSIYVALAATALAGVLAFFAATSRRSDLLLAARNGVTVASGFLTVAVAGLVYAFLVGDYQLNYVWSNSDRDMPLFYKIGALWGGQSGSLLFWSWLLSLFTIGVVIRHRNDPAPLMAPVYLTLMIIQGFFLTLIGFVSEPFARAAMIPFDGRGLNPLLQHPLMTIHPPTLYLGFVGMAVPFAFAIGALVSGRLGDEWLKKTRVWAILAWMFLAAGNVLGARWAYVELGWGGYWAWDPVENASFMPWLAVTAYLHSVMIQERRGMLKVWNMMLVITAFLLTIMGTFITRSGLISSVHTFARSPIGPWFAGFLAFLTIGAFGLLIWRRPLLRSENTLDSFLSREAGFLLNNLILLGGAFTVLLGTFFPILSEAVRGVKVSLGPPYFNAIMTPIGLGLLFLIGAGPLLAWKRMSRPGVWRAVRVPFFLSIAAAVILILVGVRHAYALVTLVLALFVLVTIVTEFIRGVRARRKGAAESVPTALGRLVWRAPRRYGGYIIHVGVVLVFVGFAGAAFTREYEETVGPGQSFEAGGYELTFEGFDESIDPAVETILANVRVSRAGEDLVRLKPHRSWYTKSEQLSTEVAIYSTWSHDLYLVLAGLDERGSAASFKVYVNPLVSWFWWGGIVMCLGGILVLLPRTRRATA
ncbi:MAG: heme lyase CcmF/NrfE family subunit [Candidatus Latescibacteria bacterium]|nr:heme lyase CcmF/NrfE family subunit [Candidatus Latescibacterota bacterium]